jgi:uncharacterized surface protein with fasciclin (FAS1) repeats
MKISSRRVAEVAVNGASVTCDGAQTANVGVYVIVTVQMPPIQ